MNPSSLAFGARASGLVLAGGALVGLAGTTTVDVALGLALVALGRAILAQRETDPPFFAVALLVLAGAAWIAGARWQSTLLADIRGAQAVVGPTLAVGTSTAVAATGLAAAAGFLAVVLWAGDAPAFWTRDAERLWIPAEVGVGAWFVVSLFVGPAVVWGGPALNVLGSVGRWIALVAFTAVAAMAAASVVRRRVFVRSVIAGLAGALVVIAAALIGSI